MKSTATLVQAKCYRLDEVLVMLKLPRASFYQNKKAGKLPFLKELQPRIGKHPRFLADPIDRYFAGQNGRGRRKTGK